MPTLLAPAQDAACHCRNSFAHDLDHPSSHLLREGAALNAAFGSTGEQVEILKNNGLNTLFQPIFDSASGKVFGYEALSSVKTVNGARVPGIETVFEFARSVGKVAPLDMLCRGTALLRSSSMAKGSEFLLLNVCPETIMDPSHPIGATNQLVECFGLQKEKVIFEITEKSAVADYALFRGAVNYYREQGYKIAIDDFGVGYGGLKMLAVIEPDFVKIDRMFVHGIAESIVTRNLVSSIATACRRLGIRVIAEGVERDCDLRVVLELGINLVQGYALARPQPQRLPSGYVTPLLQSREPVIVNPASPKEYQFVGEIVRTAASLPPDASIFAARDFFSQNPHVSSLPIVREGRVLDVLHRRTFFENILSGRLGYGEALATHKTVLQVTGGSHFKCADALETLENVALMVNARARGEQYDDICVASEGNYLGTVEVSALLEAITARSLNVARGANPLSGFPGNFAIRRDIERRIGQGISFDVSYIDIDNFKPYNDVYGFDQGDTALKLLAGCIREALDTTPDPENFVGHIGGDDFIVISRPLRSQPICQDIIDRFEKCASVLHSLNDIERGGYESTNRRGDKEWFGLLTLSIGIVAADAGPMDTFARVASRATEVKRAAKTIVGSHIARDRRQST